MKGFALALSLTTLLACQGAPYPDYWDDPAKAPRVTRVMPYNVSSTAGGETLSIEGQGLGTTRTVVVGGRNATLGTVSDNQIEVTLPPAAPGAAAVDLGLVTDFGMAVVENAVHYDVVGSDWWAEEVASAALYRIQCPIVVNDSVIWCGSEMGYADAYAFAGAGRQPGFAGDLAGFAELSALPAPGAVRAFGPGDRRPPVAPMLYGNHADDESFAIQTPRDLNRDLDLILERQEMLLEYYPWTGDILSMDDPVFWAYTEDGTCFGETEGECPSHRIRSNTVVTLAYDGNIGDSTTLELGYTWREDWFGRPYTNVVPLGTAPVLWTWGQSLTAGLSGVVMDYQPYSGWFWKQEPPGLVELADLPPDAPYKVSWSRLGKTRELGPVLGVQALTGLEPDLMTGRTMFPRRDGITLRWDPRLPDPEDEDPSVLVVELRIYDTSVDDPNWLTEVYRVMARGDDELGELTLPASILETLPLCENALTDDGDLEGMWAELGVARHQLRKVAFEEGDLVIDFIDAVQSPVRLR